MIKFTAPDDRVIQFDNGRMYGDTDLIDSVQHVIEDKIPCGCNFRGEIDPSLDTDWKAYLTICGALSYLYGTSPKRVVGVPDNPAGYQPEGPVVSANEPA